MPAKFETRAPSAQTAIDIFAGDWAGDLSKILPVSGTGSLDFFVDGDERPRNAVRHLGYNGRFEGMRILELGPMEGAHTWALERLGADVVSVENNRDAYLKCLVFKEIVGLKARVLFGDVVEYLKIAPAFDVVFCSGILYHMADPLELIEAISKITHRCFVYTHYYNKEYGNAEGQRIPRHVTRNGFEATYYELEYDAEAQMNQGWWGGSRRTRAWLTRDTIFSAFRHFGFGQIDVTHDSPVLAPGATVSFAAQRKSLD